MIPEVLGGLLGGLINYYISINIPEEDLQKNGKETEALIDKVN